MGLRQVAAGQLCAKYLELEKGNSKISMHLYGRQVVHYNTNCGLLSKRRVVLHPIECDVYTKWVDRCPSDNSFQ